MHTEHVDYLLPDYVGGRLEEPLREGLELHLRACPHCRAELETVQEVFRYLKSRRTSRPASSYYASILPRVRQRLEQKDAMSFLSHPLFIRLVSPLAAAVVAIVLFLHIPFLKTEVERDTEPLQSLVREASAAELAEAVLEQARKQPLINAVTEDEISSLVAAHAMSQEVFVQGLEPQAAFFLEPLFNGSVTQGIEELTETELDALLQKLGERTML